MATEPNAALLGDPRIPRVTLAGQEWPIPKFSIEINAIATPLLHKHLVPFLTEALAAARAAAGQGSDPDAERRFSMLLTTESIRDLAEIGFWALRRGHKDLAREEFDDMPIAAGELAGAIVTFGRQAGMLRDRKPGEQAAPLAPTPAAETSISPTGAA